MVGINWFISNFMEFKKVMDIGAYKPALPCETPPPAPIIKINLIALWYANFQEGITNLSII